MSMEGTTEPEFLTVHELADLLRLKERKVYDLAASGALPCSRATGKLLFPATEVRAWIARAQSGGVATATKPRVAVVLGSHDPLLDWALRESRSGLASYFDGSHDGLSRFCQAEGIAAGLHIYDEGSGQWNTEAVARVASEQNAVLIRFASRRRGIVYRDGLEKPTGLGALSGLRFVPRQAESGTAGLFAHLAADAGLALGDLDMVPEARTEDDAVQALCRNEADVTFGLQSIAELYGLGFVPVIEERFDLLVDRKAWFQTPMQTFVQFCRSERFRKRAEGLAGYDVSDVTKVVWNA